MMVRSRNVAVLACLVVGCVGPDAPGDSATTVRSLQTYPGTDSIRIQWAFGECLVEPPTEVVNFADDVVFRVSDSAGLVAEQSLSRSDTPSSVVFEQLLQDHLYTVEAWADGERLSGRSVVTTRVPPPVETVRQYAMAPRYSPTSDELLVTLLDDEPRVAVLDSAAAVVRVLGEPGEHNLAARTLWSDDGTEVLLWEGDSGRFVVRESGGTSGSLTLMGAQPISFDSSELHYLAEVDGLWQERVADRTGTVLRSHSLPEYSGRGLAQLLPARSPDGAQVAYTARLEDGTRGIRVESSDGSTLIPLPEGIGWGFESGPVWSSDGGALAVGVALGGCSHDTPVWTVEISTGVWTRQTVFDDALSISAETLTWSADGATIAFAGSELVQRVSVR